MKINLNQKLKTFDGETLKTSKQIGKKIEEVPFTISEAIINSLTANFEDEKDLTGEEKVKRFIIAQKVQRNKDKTIDLSVEDVSMVKKLVGKAFGVLIVGQVWEILEK